MRLVEVNMLNVQPQVNQHFTCKAETKITVVLNGLGCILKKKMFTLFEADKT